MKGDGGFAFPVNSERGPRIECSQGMTLRDYLAAKALQGLLSGPPYDVLYEDGTPCKSHDEVRGELSRRAYAYADAMIAERDK